MRVAGIGTDVRHRSPRALMSGITMGIGSTASGAAAASVRFSGAGAESSRSDAAQQRSASAWLRACPELCRAVSAACIGHVPSPAQQAMRSSGVGIQPAQTAGLPTARASTMRTAAPRRERLNTLLRMREAMAVVKPASRDKPSVEK